MCEGVVNRQPRLAAENHLGLEGDKRPKNSSQQFHGGLVRGGALTRVGLGRNHEIAGQSIIDQDLTKYKTDSSGPSRT